MYVAARDERVRLGLAARGGRFVFTRGGRAAEPYGSRALRQPSLRAAEPYGSRALRQPSRQTAGPIGRQFLVQFLVHVHWSTFSILCSLLYNVVSSN